jgi:tRNA(Ile)-lysidine synthase
MSAELYQQVLATIRLHRMMQPGDRAGVAVSSGGDSVALLLLLDELRAELGITLAVLHLNHQLRGAESDADERFVAELAAGRGLECIIERRDVAAEARRSGLNLEEAGRQQRYAFFADVVRAGRVTRVAVAHTADDQAETVLARLLRGTGPTGLAGIYPVVGSVVRPLIEVRRAALRDFLRARQQAWREDASNQDASRLRARIRQRLVPLLETEFQSAAVERLASLAALARREEEFWRALLDRLFAEHVEQTREGLRLSLAGLLFPFGAQGMEAPPALQARFIRRVFEGLKGHRRQLTAGHVEQVMHLAAHSAGGTRLDLPGGVVVEKTLDRGLLFSLRGETAAAPPAYEYVVALPERGTAAVSVPEIGRRYFLKVIDWPAGASDTRSSLAALDADLLRPPLVLRNWRPGDAYRPQGARSVRKLKRLFLECRIAARERPGWPVLTSAGHVAWAGRLPAAEAFAARPGTRAGLVIVEESL